MTNFGEIANSSRSLTKLLLLDVAWGDDIRTGKARLKYKISSFALSALAVHRS